MQCTQEPPGLNPDCFREIRLMPKKYFNISSVYNTFENLAADWKKRDWTIVFDVRLVAFLKYMYNVSFFKVSFLPFYRTMFYRNISAQLLLRNSSICTRYVINSKDFIKKTYQKRIWSNKRTSHGSAS